MIFVLGGYYRETSEVSADQLASYATHTLLSLSVQSTNTHTNIQYRIFNQIHSFIYQPPSRGFLFYFIVFIFLFGQISTLLPFHLLFLAFGYWAGPSSFIVGGFMDPFLREIVFS
jgi:hypothetical protein